MKKIKSSICVILCICFVSALFASCSISHVKFIGSWTTTLDLSETFNKAINDSIKDELNIDINYDGVFTINTKYTFNLNEKCTVETSKSQYKIEVADYTKRCSQYISKKIYSYYKSHNNMSKSAVDKRFKNEYGQDVAGYLKDKLSAVLNNEKITKPLNTTTNFSVDGDKIFKENISGEVVKYQTYTLDGDTLTLTAEYNNDGSPVDESKREFKCPQVFTKVNNQSETTK